MKQIDRLRAHLDQGHTVTKKSAAHLLDIINLTPHIERLTREGYPLQQRRVTVSTRWGTNQRVAEWWKKRERVAREWNPMDID